MSASATACSAVRNERWAAGPPAASRSLAGPPMAAAIALPYSMPTSSAMASASASGSRESALLEQRDEEVVVADRELEAHLRASVTR